ncbi:ABC transporter substrate-binding protein [Paenibacillus psychroresistens]|nr:iron-siderophore ABC transporter substrate-binding protein [Paenibacillus psychroresistens]
MKLKNQATAVFISLLMVVIIAVGCGTKEETKTQTESPQATAAPTAAPTAVPTASAEPTPAANRIVTTILGDVEIPANPTRIALTYHDDIDHLMALGIKPIAVPTYDRTGQIDGYLPYLAEGLKGVEKIGNVPSAEAILSTNPDLIIAGYSHKDVIGELNKIAPTLFFEWKMDWRETHLALGKALGLESKAQANIDEYNALLEDAKSKLKAAVGNQTVAFIRLTAKEIRIHGLKDQVPGYILYDQLGLTPSEGVPKETWAEPISKEVFAQMKVDHIFMHVDEDSDTELLKKELLENEIYKNIPAVKNGQVHLVPNHPWNRGGPLAFKEGIQQVLAALIK